MKDDVLDEIDDIVLAVADEEALYGEMIKSMSTLMDLLYLSGGKHGTKISHLVDQYDSGDIYEAIQDSFTRLYYHLEPNIRTRVPE